jgi:hypothetical protein
VHRPGVGAALLVARVPYLLLAVHPPYRDENESLRKENERLRVELSKKRVSHPVLALMLAALDLVLLVMLRPWLNGASDARFWAALGSIAVLGLAAAGAALGRRRVMS